MNRILHNGSANYTLGVILALKYKGSSVHIRRRVLFAKMLALVPRRYVKRGEHLKPLLVEDL
jgi:hypothetical protein